jgi:excisionase family DNA binding protein
METKGELTLALRPREAARAIGVSARTLWTLTKRREVPFVKLGTVVLYPVALLQEWLEKRAKERFNGGQSA